MFSSSVVTKFSSPYIGSVLAAEILYEELEETFEIFSKPNTVRLKGEKDMCSGVAFLFSS